MALNPKQKKRLKIGIIIASIATLLIATPIAAFYALFFDANAKDTFVPKEVNYQNIFADSVTNGMDKMKDENIVSFTSSEEQINEAFKVFKGRSYEFGRYISNVEYNFEKKEFYFDVQVPLFKTRLLVDATPSYDEENQNFLIKINDMKIGRFGSVMSLMNKVKDNKQIIKALMWMFGDMSANVQFDKDNMTFIYPLEDIAYDLYTIAFDDPAMLFAGLLSQSIHDGNGTASLEGKSFFTSISRYKHENKYDISAYDNVTWPYKGVMDNYITPMLKDKVFERANDSEKLRMLRFLMLGYDNIGENEQEYFKANYDLLKYGVDIPNYKSPVQDRLNGYVDLGQKISDLIDLEIANNQDKFANGYKFAIPITEDDIRNNFLTAPMLFSGYIPSSLDGNKYHYGLIDDCYFNLVNGGFAIVSKFNVEENIITHSGLFGEPEKDNKEETKKANNNIYEFALKETLFGDIEAYKHADWSYAIYLNNCLGLANSFMRFQIDAPGGEMRETSKKDYKLLLDFNAPISGSKFYEVISDKGLLFDTSLTIDDSQMSLTFELKG